MSDKKTFFDKLPENLKTAAKEIADNFKTFKAEFLDTPPATPPTGDVKMGEGALADGTPIKYSGDTLAIGSDVVLVTPEGEVPAPDGEVTLADGTVLTMAGGKVTDMKEAASAEEAMANEKTIADVKERVTKIVEKFEAEFTALKSITEKQKIEIDNLKLKLGKQAKAIIDNHEMIVAFGGVETEDAIEPPVLSDKAQRLEVLKKAINNTKK